MPDLIKDKEAKIEAVKDELQEAAEHVRPEPPKDENGNPIAPPEGGRPPFGKQDEK